MIAQTNPLITAMAVAIAVMGSSMIGHYRKAAVPGRLSGVLYSISADTQAARAAAASMPEIDIGLDPAARAALPPASALVVRFVGIDESTFTLTLARRLHEDSSRLAASGRASASPRPHKRAGHPMARPSETASPAVTAVAAAAPSSTAVALVAPTLAPTPTSPPTFAEIDDALRASSTAQAVDFRVKKGGVSFRLTQIGRVGKRYVIRYAIANEEHETFFLSIINVSAGGNPIPSETAGTYSCATGQEVYGVVYFSPADVAGKNVVAELVQSGGEHRRFSLTADYAF